MGRTVVWAALAVCVASNFFTARASEYLSDLPDDAFNARATADLESVHRYRQGLRQALEYIKARQFTEQKKGRSSRRV